jgi:hypothetical protein
MWRGPPRPPQPQSRNVSFRQWNMAAKRRFKQLSLENPFRGRARVGVRVHAHAPPAHDAKEDDDLFGTADNTFVHELDDGANANDDENGDELDEQMVVNGCAVPVLPGVEMHARTITALNLIVRVARGLGHDWLLRWVCFLSVNAARRRRRSTQLHVRHLGAPFSAFVRFYYDVQKWYPFLPSSVVKKTTLKIP